MLDYAKAEFKGRVIRVARKDNRLIINLVRNTISPTNDAKSFYYTLTAFDEVADHLGNLVKAQDFLVVKDVNIIGNQQGKIYFNIPHIGCYMILPPDIYTQINNRNAQINFPFQG